MKEKILEWLDKLAQNQKERFALAILSVEDGKELSIAFDSEPIIHIFNIEKICEIAEIVPEVEPVKDKPYKKYSFSYNDVVFMGFGGEADE